MKGIKFLILCLLVLSIELVSCNKNEGTLNNIPLPVIEKFDPMMKVIPISGIHDLAPLRESLFVVNSISELPEDKIFGNEEFLDQDIDFSQYSLIIFYNHPFGKVLSCKYNWGYSYDFEEYIVSTEYKIEKYTFNDEGEIEFVTYVKGAMLVDKIPSTSKVTQMIGVQAAD